MKTFLLIALLAVVEGFQPSAPLFMTQAANKRADVCMAKKGYVPSGMTAAQWKAIQEKEASEKKANLGRVGSNKFKSRSMASFVQALERGEAGHLFPVDPEKVKSGEIALKDVPYMQRGGAWDNSDVRGVKKTKWSKLDKAYDGEQQSASIFGGANLPWNLNKREERPQMAKQEFFGKVGRAGGPAAKKVVGRGPRAVAGKSQYTDNTRAAKKVAKKAAKKAASKRAGVATFTKNTESKRDMANAAKKGPFGLW